MSDSGSNGRLEKARRIIRALLAKTVENGATEDEAIAAAEKAAELMTKWDLDPADVSDRHDDRPAFRKVRLDPAMEDAFWRVAHAIADLCQCRTWVQFNGSGVFNFAGDEIDSQIAEYLMSICARSIVEQTARADRVYALYRANIRHRKRLGFIHGMSTRLAVRVSELAWQRRKAAGTGLVPAKLRRIDEFMAGAGMEFRTGGVHQTITDPEALKQGRDRADSVGLSRAVGSGDGVGPDFPALIEDGAGRG